MSAKVPCPACGRYVARTLTGGVRPHNDGRCACPVKRKCRGGAAPFPCTFTHDEVLCLAKIHAPRQLKMFE